MSFIGTARLIRAVAVTSIALWSGHVSAAPLRATMALAGVEGPGQAYGTVTLSAEDGVLHLEPELHGLPAGRYVVEIHQGRSCDRTFESHPGPEGASPLMPVPAGAAGDRLPLGGGRDELGALTVSPDGKAERALAVSGAPDVLQFQGRSLILRGDRLLCGVLR